MAEEPQPQRAGAPGRAETAADRIASRALLFILLTGVGVLVYAVCFAVLGPEARSAMAVLVGGVLAAVLLLVRDAAQRGVDRLLYGERRTPERALLRVGQRAADPVDGEALVGALAETLAAALRLSYVEVLLDGAPPGSRVGSPTRRVCEVPLVHRGRRLGVLRAGRRGEAPNRADLEVLTGAAPQLAAAAETVRLTRGLATARERLVRAREEERRRLRRDLHDVLGPALAGVGLGLDAVRARAARDPAGADELVARVQEEVRGCVAEIRSIIEGLRPPVLDELGLAGALRQSAELLGARVPGLRVTVAADGLPPLPAAVEVSAHLIAEEALTNAVRHAGATRIDVRVSADGGAVHVEVDDDGTGLPAARRPGVGLRSMAERAEELGGALTLGPAPGGGTRVGARLPLAAADPALVGEVR